MQKRLVIGLALALSVAPLAARADAPPPTPLIGTPCDKTQVGMTRMDTDDENIIACLKAGSIYQWKAMDGGGGGANCGKVPNMGVCGVLFASAGFDSYSIYQCVDGTWYPIVGTGYVEPIQNIVPGIFRACN